MPRECAARYRRFCQGYTAQPKTSGTRRSAWGQRALPDATERERAHRHNKLTRSQKEAGQLSFTVKLHKTVPGTETLTPALPLLEKAQETARRFAKANLTGSWA